MTVPIHQVDLGGGAYSVLNISSATVAVTGPCRLACVTIRTQSAAVGAVYDSASTSGNSSANQILVIPINKAAGNVYRLNWPITNGIVVSPGASGNLVIAWDNVTA